MRQNILKRARLFSKRYLDAKRMSYTKRKYLSESPPLLINSIPKSGTNLLDSLLKEFPGFAPRAGRTLMEWGGTSDRTINRISSIKSGYYQLAHLPMDEKLAIYLDKLGLKTVMIVRDPRDVLVSNYKYVLNMDVTHKSHKYIKDQPNNIERIKACIVGREGVIAPIYDVYKSYSGWLDSKNCLVVKFEDLVGSKGGGCDKIQREKVVAILKFLDVVVSEAELDHIVEKMKSPNTPTFRAGKTGGWKSHFDDELLSFFDDHIKDMMALYGYG